MERVERGTIAIINRYKDVCAELEPISETKYKFINKGAYYRLIFSSDKSTVVAIDPEGGPFIYVGMTTGNIKIIQIEKKENEIILTVESCKN